MMPLLLLAALLVAPDVSSPAKTGDALRVATFNIRYGTAKDGENRWEVRKPLFLETMKKMDADVLGMQEVLVFQLEETKQALPEYEFVGVGRNDGKREGEFVPVGFKSKKFEKLGEGHFWLSETPDVVGSRGWDAALPRMVTWVRLRERGTGRVMLFVNTHFDHIGVRARAESAKLLRTRFEEMRKQGEPVIIVGDFNATEDEEPYTALLGKAGGAGELVDSYRTAHATREAEKEGTFHGFEGYRNGKRIDWIVHTPDLKTVSCDVVYHADGKRYPSDHYPVEAVLQFNKPDQP